MLVFLSTLSGFPFMVTFFQRRFSGPLDQPSKANWHLPYLQSEFSQSFSEGFVTSSSVFLKGKSWSAGFNIESYRA